MDDDSFAIGLVVGRLETQNNADSIADALSFIGMRTPHGLSFYQLCDLIKTIVGFGVSFKFYDNYTPLEIDISKNIISIEMASIAESLEYSFPTTENSEYNEIAGLISIDAQINKSIILNNITESLLTTINP